MLNFIDKTQLFTLKILSREIGEYLLFSQLHKVTFWKQFSSRAPDDFRLKIRLNRLNKLNSEVRLWTGAAHEIETWTSWRWQPMRAQDDPKLTNHRPGIWPPINPEGSDGGQCPCQPVSNKSSNEIIFKLAIDSGSSCFHKSYQTYLRVSKKLSQQINNDFSILSLNTTFAFDFALIYKYII